MHDSFNSLILAAGVLLLAFMVSRVVAFGVRWYLQYRIARSQNRFDDFLLETIQKPLPYAILVGALLGVVSILDLDPAVRTVFEKVVMVTVALEGMYILAKFSDALFRRVIFPTLEVAGSKKNSYILPLSFTRRVTKVAIVILGGTIALNVIGIKTNSILAGVGITSLAIGFAAKDVLANVISSVIVAFDRPFQLGDHVIIGGKHRGRVHAVGVRTTVLVTEKNTHLYIPNAEIANSSIENVGRQIETHDPVESTAK